MRLIITRHGETIDNTNGICQGQMQGVLSKRGIEQAQRVAQRLKNEKIDVIYSSDLARAADTAKIIAKYHKVSIHLTKKLRERFVGKYEGKPIYITNPEIQDITGIPESDNESIKELYERAINFLKEILKKHKNQTVLLVGHNGINKALFCAITGKNEKDIVPLEKTKNTSITIFEIDENKNYKTHTYNCTKHLE
jgi:broad specificity phosphatase PhoE